MVHFVTEGAVGDDHSRLVAGPCDVGVRCLTACARDDVRLCAAARAAALEPEVERSRDGEALSPAFFCAERLIAWAAASFSHLAMTLLK